MGQNGIHYITATAGRVERNHAFHMQTVGLRLVKKLVTQQDVSAFHRFGRGDGRTGSDVTVLGWPVKPERRSSQGISRAGMRVAGAGTRGWIHQVGSGDDAVTHQAA